ncbi:hypothetical protein MF672_014020 [Actinomadura sp. ATCC 31491]|uniref:GNAT family N-acetyltransferase n=1 Tax=Actinomadura luzonensis TaxID=2805427 RepID=A0ABT0FRG4_9ACTN|nr:hypothetical protein [Actinomadura luzonensis]MCK2214895.1 hypothetical protein [Actinomadura luzonensis]
MADTITIRSDAETEHALDVLTQDGSSRSAATKRTALSPWTYASLRMTEPISGSRSLSDAMVLKDGDGLAGVAGL